jgi:hypothetical protein
VFEKKPKGQNQESRHKESIFENSGPETEKDFERGLTACNNSLKGVHGELVEPVVAAGDLVLADQVRLPLQVHEPKPVRLVCPQGGRNISCSLLWSSLPCPLHKLPAVLQRVSN